MFDLNRVMLIWRTTGDAEVKKSEAWTSIVPFSLATNRRYKNKEGNQIEEAEFHRCVAFGNIADIFWQYLNKWKRIYIEGRLRTRKWEDGSWNNRYTTEIIVEDFIFLDSKWGDNSSNSSNSQSWDTSGAESSSDSEEDLPF